MATSTHDKDPAQHMPVIGSDFEPHARALVEAALCTDAAEREGAEAEITALYKAIGFTFPVRFIWADSPASAFIIRRVLQRETTLDVLADRIPWWLWRSVSKSLEAVPIVSWRTESKSSSTASESRS